MTAKKWRKRCFLIDYKHKNMTFYTFLEYILYKYKNKSISLHFYI